MSGTSATSSTDQSGAIENGRAPILSGIPSSAIWKASSSIPTWTNGSSDGHWHEHRSNESTTTNLRMNRFYHRNPSCATLALCFAPTTSPSLGSAPTAGPGGSRCPGPESGIEDCGIASRPTSSSSAGNATVRTRNRPSEKAGSTSCQSRRAQRAGLPGERKCRQVATRPDMPTQARGHKCGPEKSLTL